MLILSLAKQANRTHPAIQLFLVGISVSVESFTAESWRSHQKTVFDREKI
jgi:hypothetical protein